MDLTDEGLLADLARRDPREVDQLALHEHGEHEPA
jgi:hypothetical protein